MVSNMLNKKFAIFLFFLFVNLTFTLKILGANTTIGIVLFLIFPFLVLDYTRVSLKILIFVIFLVALLRLNPYGISSILFFILAGYAMRNCNFRYIVWCNFICQSVFLFVNFLLLRAGYINDVCVQKAGVAHDFGYQNPNSFAIYVIYIIASLYLLIYKTHKAYLFLLILFITPLVYYLTYSRSIILTSSILLLTLIIPDLFIKKYIFNKMNITLLYIIIPLIALFIASNSTLWDYLNEASSSRIAYVSILLESFSIKTLITGMKLPDEVVLDNVYLHTMLYGGILTLLFILCQFYNIFINNQYPVQYLSFLLMFFFFGFIESCFTNPFISGSYLVWMLLVGNKTLYHTEE